MIILFHIDDTDTQETSIDENRETISLLKYFIENNQHIRHFSLFENTIDACRD